MLRPYLGQALGLSLGVLIVALQTAVAEDLTTTSPRHFRSGVSQAPAPWSPKIEEQVTIRELPTSVMLHEDAHRGVGDMDLDRRLSAQCRAGRLRQYRDRQFVVRLAGYIHGAAIGGHWSLIDTRGQATPGQIYAFRHPGSGRCEIYRINR